MSPREWSAFASGSGFTFSFAAATEGRWLVMIVCGLFGLLNLWYISRTRLPKEPTT